MGKTNSPESWTVHVGFDLQELNNELLRTHFIEAELEFSDLVIRLLGEITSS
jgi:hypothetical protein